jgi:hypothetical protein
VPPPAVKVTEVPAQNVLSGSELVSVGEGRGFTVFIMLADVAVHPAAVVTTTSTACPFVRVVVANVFKAPDCTEDPATLKL